VSTEFHDFSDRYGNDVLAGFSKRAGTSPPPRVVEATTGLVVEEVASDFVGAVTRVEGRLVELEDRRGTRRMFPLGPGFLLEGEAVAVRAPREKPTGVLRTASGSLAPAEQRARVARASRIFVEGRHDAELVEKVWGTDLRVEGVVVEYLEGVDKLEAVLRDFGPSSERRVGVLVDHLVTGSKESRVADAVAAGPHGSFVSVLGHPFIDIWQAVKPARLGIAAWPTVARGTDWKHGVCEALGWPHESQEDIAAAWQRILGSVRTYADLEPALLGPVEQLIDFVTDTAER
jgi:hypothetical protein